MSEAQPKFPSPTSCPFISPRPQGIPKDHYSEWGELITDNRNIWCGVDREGVPSELEKARCRGSFAGCEKYSKKVYEDLMSAVRDGIKVVAEKDPESLLRVFAPTGHSSTTNE